MKKIDLYIFIQIFKSCTLVFFIFVSIAWLLQITRLFSVLSNLQIEFIEILFLSIFLIPNLLNIILPFIIIFGLLIAFIKLEKDREIIAIYSLGLSINRIKNPILIFSVLISIIYLILNLYLSPLIYDIYKKKEFELRNLINLNNINISNFIELDKNLILDFKKDKNKFVDVFIRFYEKNDMNIDNENIIYSKEAKINKETDYLLFNLINGFKLNFIDEKIEKLEFKNYKLKFPILENKKYNNIDKNSLTIFNLIKNNNKYLIIERSYDIFILIFIIILFYHLNIKSHKYKLKNILFFLIISTLMLIFQNLIKTIELKNLTSIILFTLNIIIMLFLIIINKLRIK